MASITTTLMCEPTLPIIPHTTQPIIEAEAEAEAEAEMFRKQAYAIRGLTYPGPRRITPKRSPLAKTSSTPSARRPKGLGAGQTVSAAPTHAPAEEKEPSFSRLIEDLLRTHSSTASPYGQHLSHSILNDSNKVYLGNFYGGIGSN